MKILVTGAAGFLGRHVVRECRDRGHDVVAVVRPSSGRRDADAEVKEVTWDLRQRTAPVGALADVDAVIHLAAQKSGDFYEQFGSTVIATENLLLAMAERGVRRLVHISSYSVYDYDQLKAGQCLDESSPTDLLTSDRDDYAKTKLLQEQLVTDFARAGQGDVTVLRPGVVVGSADLWNACLGIEMGGRFLVVGPSQKMPLTYVENTADAIVDAVQSRESIGRTINIVDDELPTRRDFVRELERRGVPGPRPMHVPWFAAHALAWLASTINSAFFGGRMRLPGILIPTRLKARFLPLRHSNVEAKRILGWSPSYGLEASLDRSVAERAAAP